MTDNEIIKALKLCTSEHMGCEDGCPYATKKLTYSQCKLELSKDIIDLINRLKAEIFKLKEENANLKSKNSDFLNRNEKAKVERAEAYKEFADKLAGAFNKDINLYGRCTISDVALKINTTLKELTDQTATNHSVSLIDGHIEE